MIRMRYRKPDRDHEPALARGLVLVVAGVVTAGSVLIAANLSVERDRYRQRVERIDEFCLDMAVKVADVARELRFIDRRPLAYQQFSVYGDAVEHCVEGSQVEEFHRCWLHNNTTCMTTFILQARAALQNRPAN